MKRSLKPDDFKAGDVLMVAVFDFWVVPRSVSTGNLGWKPTLLTVLNLIHPDPSGLCTHHGTIIDITGKKFLIGLKNCEWECVS